MTTDRSTRFMLVLNLLTFLLVVFLTAWMIRHQTGASLSMPVPENGRGVGLPATPSRDGSSGSPSSGNRDDAEGLVLGSEPVEVLGREFDEYNGGWELGDGWLFFFNGSMTKRLQCSDDSIWMVAFTARRDLCNDKGPNVTVSLDGRRLGGIGIEKSGPGVYGLTVRLSPGLHHLTLAYDNDQFAAHGNDRNLCIVKMGLRRLKVLGATDPLVSSSQITSIQQHCEEPYAKAAWDRMGSADSFRTEKGWFHPSRIQDLVEVFSLYLTPKTTFLDLGSGDGRVVLLAAMYGLSATGVEWDEELVRISNEARGSLSSLVSPDRAHFIKGDFLLHDFSTYDVIYIYFSTDMPEALWSKLEKEMKPGSLFIAFDEHPKLPDRYETILEDNARKIVVYRAR